MMPQRLLAIVLLTIAGARSVSGQPAPAAPPVRAELEGGTFHIGPGDILQIDVWKEPEASTPSVTVRPDGGLSLPMIGEVQAGGLKTTELQSILAEKYGAMIRDARVTVSIREVHSQRVYLIGEVRREGPVRLVGPLTVLQALAEAGGLTDYARRKQIYILRIIGERRVILPFDYDAVVRGTKISQNIVLQPGDTVVVPR